VSSVALVIPTKSESRTEQTFPIWPPQIGSILQQRDATQHAFQLRGFISLSWESGGGRTWWAHFEFTRINIVPTIPKNQIEDLMNVKGIGEKNFLKLKARLTVAAPIRRRHL
jgi:hypothetical protein